MLAALLLAAPGASAVAQIPSDQLGATIVDVELDGPEGLLPDTPTPPLPIGEVLGPRVLRELVGNLGRTGRWADVQVEVLPVAPGQVRLLARLAPRVVLQRLDLIGQQALDRDALVRAMDLSPGDEISPEVLATRTTAAERLYAEVGFPLAQVDAFVRDTDDRSQKVVVVRVVEGPPARIGAVRFSGSTPPEPAPLIAAIGLTPGTRFDRRELVEGLRKGGRFLRDRGWLEAEVGAPEMPAAGATEVVDLTLPLHLGPRYGVRLLGRGRVPRGEVVDALDLGEERLAGPASLEAMTGRVVDAYVQRGFLDATVRIERRRASLDDARRSGREAELVVFITPGPQVDVAAITFPGARHFDDGFLRREVISYLEEDLPGSAVFQPVDPEVADTVVARAPGTSPQDDRPPPLVVDPRRVFFDPTYREATTHLEELYAADGYLDARVGPPRLQRVEPESGIAVVPVVEGPRTMLGQITVDGQEVVGGAVLLREAALSPEMPFSYLTLEEARLRILDWYRERGYLFARVEPDVVFSPDRTRADVTFEVLERFEVRVGEVIIRGAERTSEGMVRELVELSPGDVLRPAKSRASQESLLALGVFSSVTVQPDAPDLPEQSKDLVVTLTERPTQFLELRGGVSTGEGARGGFEYGYRNLFGLAISLNVRVQLAFQFLIVDPEFRERIERLGLVDRLERRVSAGVELPWIRGLPDTRLALDLVNQRDNQRDFGLDKNAAVLTLTWRPDRRLTVTGTTELENNDVDLFVESSLDELRQTIADPRLQQLLRVPEGASTLFAAGPAVSVDFRDSPFNPTRGFFASVSGQWNRTLVTESFPIFDESDPPQTVGSFAFLSNFLKVSVTANGYLPLADGVVLALQGRWGRIIHLDPDSETYPNRAFFLGGVNTMRGYLQDAMFPQDQAEAILSSANRANCAVVDAGGELPGDEICRTVDNTTRNADTFALFRTELRFPLFGNLRGGIFMDLGNLWLEPDRLDLLALRPNVGLGLRVDTPVGPLAFDYGFNVVRRGGLDENLGAFHFSIGVF